MLNVLGRYSLYYFFIKLIIGAGFFAYYEITANYHLPWITQILLAFIIILLTLVCISNKAAEGLIFVPVLFFVFLYFEISGLKTFDPQLRTGFIDLLYPYHSIVSFRCIVSVVCFSVVLYWNVKISDNKAIKRMIDQTISVFVKRPKKLKR